MTTDSDKIDQIEKDARNYVTYSVFFTVVGMFLGLVVGVFSYQMSRINNAEAKLDNINDINIKLAGMQVDILYIRKSLDQHLNY